PVARWSCPGERRRKRANQRFFAFRLGQLIDQEQVYTTLDAVGAAVWALPDRWRMTAREALGTDPPRQGEGIGSALLAPVLELCDRDHVPAYLESSKEQNVAFYSRHGFRVTDELHLPKGPPVW